MIAVVTIQNEDQILTLHIQEGTLFRTEACRTYREGLFKDIQHNLESQGYTFQGTIHMVAQGTVDQWIYSK